MMMLNTSTEVKKGDISGFAAASVLLIVFILYDMVISGNYSSQLLIILGSSQAVYWGSRIYYERVM